MKLGQMGKDRITGYVGLCTGMAQYLTGCSQVLLTPTKLSKEGKRQDGEWFDEQRIQPTSDKVLALDNRKTPGLDEPLPPRR